MYLRPINRIVKQNVFSIYQQIAECSCTHVFPAVRGCGLHPLLDVVLQVLLSLLYHRYRDPGTGGATTRGRGRGRGPGAGGPRHPGEREKSHNLNYEVI